MQIHELTKKKNTQIDEGIADTLGAAVGKGISGVKNAGQAVAAPFKDVAGGYKAGRQDQKIGAMADKAYRAWKGYEAQLLKSDPQARENGLLQKSLMAFVQKNLLGNMQLANVTNKDKIIGVIKQISGSNTPSPDPQQDAQAKQHTGGKVAGQVSQTPGAVAKRNARANASQAATAGAGAFGQMAGQLASKAPNTMATAPVSKVNVAKTTNPNQPQQTPLQQATALHQQVQGQVPTSRFGKVPSTTAPVAVKGATKAGAPTPAEYEKLQQKIAAASNKPAMNEALPTVKPTVRPVGSLAARAKQRNAPAPAAPAPATTTAPVASATPAPATTTAAPAATPAPANELELFKKLVRYAALAANDVNPEKSAEVKIGNGTQIKSTGNPEADKLLTTQGFVIA